MNLFLQITGALVWLLVAGGLLGRLWRAIQERAQLEMAQRWVVVTGCDSGLGLGTVEKLVAAKAKVIACTFTAAGAENAAKAGAKQTLQFDLTDEAAVQNAVAQIKEITGGQLWGLVHNAGMVLPGFVEYQLLETYRRVMEVNYFAVVRLTQPLLPLLKATQGRVVIVSSVDGIVSLPGNAPYDGSKFAVEGYADALRVELALWQVHVAVVNPATMRTPLALNFFAAHQKAWELMQQHDPAGAWQKTWTREWLAAYIALNSKNLASIAEDPHHAVRDIVHGVVARQPRLRYLSGTLAKTLFWALWKMPEAWAFKIKLGTINPRPKL